MSEWTVCGRGRTSGVSSGLGVLRGVLSLLPGGCGRHVLREGGGASTGRGTVPLGPYSGVDYWGGAGSSGGGGSLGLGGGVCDLTGLLESSISRGCGGG